MKLHKIKKVNQTEDREVILQLQKGSLEALGVLYDRHRTMVYRTALAITGDPEAASDLLQDVFLRLNRFAAIRSITFLARSGGGSKSFTRSRRATVSWICL